MSGDVGFFGILVKKASNTAAIRRRETIYAQIKQNKTGAYIALQEGGRAGEKEKRKSVYNERRRRRQREDNITGIRENASGVFFWLFRLHGDRVSQCGYFRRFCPAARTYTDPRQQLFDIYKQHIPRECIEISVLHIAIRRRRRWLKYTSAALPSSPDFTAGRFRHP